MITKRPTTIHLSPETREALERLREKHRFGRSKPSLSDTAEAVIERGLAAGETEPAPSRRA
jgi:hypothetical protein